LAVGALVLAIAVTGCGGTAAAPTQAPSASSAPASTPSAAHAAVPSVTNAAPAVGSPTALTLAALPLLWQKSGPPQTKPGTYWPAIDPVTGDVWVASSFDNAYWIFSADGKYLESWGQAGKGPGQFTLQTHDLNPDGQGAIAFAPDGSFFVVDTGNYRVEKFDRNRKFVTQWGTFGTGDGQFAQPKGIATDGKTVYVADDPRGDIQAFDTNGKFLRSFQFPFVLFSLAPSGHLFGGDNASNSGATGVVELDGLGNQISRVTLNANDTGGGGGISLVTVDQAGHVFVPIQDRSFPAAPFELIELDGHGSVLHRWAAGGETAALAPDGTAIYFAYTGPQGNWSYLRKYAIPKG
jgi:DNA-binding beta-propeller fold protein YncE